MHDIKKEEQQNAISKAEVYKQEMKEIQEKWNQVNQLK